MFIKNGKMVLLQATSSVPSGYLSAFEVIGSKAQNFRQPTAVDTVTNETSWP